jgi:hypothetical protein
MKRKQFSKRMMIVSVVGMAICLILATLTIAQEPPPADYIDHDWTCTVDQYVNGFDDVSFGAANWDDNNHVSNEWVVITPGIPIQVRRYRMIGTRKPTVQAEHNWLTSMTQQYGRRKDWIEQNLNGIVLEPSEQDFHEQALYYTQDDDPDNPGNIRVNGELRLYFIPMPMPPG